MFHKAVYHCQWGSPFGNGDASAALIDCVLMFLVCSCTFPSWKLVLVRLKCLFVYLLIELFSWFGFRDMLCI